MLPIILLSMTTTRQCQLCSLQRWQEGRLLLLPYQCPGPPQFRSLWGGTSVKPCTWGWCSLASLDAASLSGIRADTQSCSTMHVWSAALPLVHSTAATLLLPHSRESTGEIWQVSRATLYMQAGSGLTVWALLIFFTSHWPSPV